MKPATCLLHCDTSSSDDSKLYGWTEGTDCSTDVSDTTKKRTMASKTHEKRRTKPPPTHLGKGRWPSPAQASLSRASLRRDP